MATTTTNMSLTKPAVNSATDEDLWGTQLNTDLDTLDSWISKEEWHFGPFNPVAGDRTIILKARYPGTITETTTKCVAGTATATFKIDGVALGGTANSVSTSDQSQSHASANTFAAGATISITLSSVSGCQLMNGSIFWTRTGAGS